MPDPEHPRRPTQKRLVYAIALLLILGGLAVMIALKRMPVAMRLFVGLTDVIAGLVLLNVARQKL